MIQFADGITIDKEGDPRIMYYKREFYVVGNGVIHPVKDMWEGENLVRNLKE